MRGSVGSRTGTGTEVGVARREFEWWVRAGLAVLVCCVVVLGGLVGREVVKRCAAVDI